MQAMKRLGFVNAYTLTKAIAEHQKPTAETSEAEAASLPSGTGVKLNLTVTYDFSALSYIPALGVKR